jgi:hypothetical protein
MARRKYKSLEEIWDSNREKLLVMGTVHLFVRFA